MANVQSSSAPQYIAATASFLGIAIETRFNIYGFLLTPRHEPVCFEKGDLVAPGSDPVDDSPTAYEHSLSHSFPWALLIASRQIFIEASDVYYRHATRRIFLDGQTLPPLNLYSGWGHRQLAFRIELIVENRLRLGGTFDAEFRKFCRGLNRCLGPDRRLKKLTIHHNLTFPDVDDFDTDDEAPGWLDALSIIAPKVNEVVLGHLVVSAAYPYTSDENPPVGAAIRSAMAVVPTISSIFDNPDEAADEEYDADDEDDGEEEGDDEEEEEEEEEDDE